MRRRKFIALLSGAAVTWPLVARAQQPGEMRRIGALMNLSENDPEAQRLVATFREGLAQLGPMAATCASTAFSGLADIFRSASRL
jgi:hypothetical protein